jgi:hypothetical protein
MKQLELPELVEFGTDPKLLVRRDDPDTSHAAAQTVNSSELEKLVFETIKRFADGCTQDDVLALNPTKPYSSITARFRALLDKGFIEDTGERKPGRSGKPQRIVKVKTWK